MAEDISRRGVIGLGVGAALVAGGSRVSAQTGGARQGERAKDSVGVAIVGIGLLSAGQLLPALTRTKKAHLAALVSGDPAKAKRTAAQYGLPESAIYNYQSYDRLADNPDVEIVYIVLPNNMHREYTERA